jgi:NAD(P)-dependent dehydrogenase (short-subunit alcohol dehydrogenase family)
MALALSGANVAITSTTPDAEEAFELRRLAKRIGETGRRTMAESIDLSIATSVQIAVRQVAKELGGIDLAIVAADLRLEQKPADRISDADWAKVIGLNLSGVFYACRSVAREMLRTDPLVGTTRGQIIVLTAEVGATGADASYSAAKAGTIGLVKALEREWRPQGILVSTLTIDSGARDDAKVANAVAEAMRLVGRIAR